MDILEKFFKIRAWYAAYDEEVRQREGKTFFRTDHGLWGAAGLLDAFEFFMKADIGRLGTLADYGSGDGRIVLVAALFTEAVGVEGDASLTTIAERAKKELCETVPELTKDLDRATFKTSNYYEEDHKQYQMLFFFPDHAFPKEFQDRLAAEWNGYLFVYNRIHLPEQLKKGKTYWVQQLPIVTYPINREEEDLFFSRNVSSPVTSAPSASDKDKQ